MTSDSPPSAQDASLTEPPIAWEVVVVGAGAAGLLAAIRAAERGRRTLLLEKNRKAGVKILMSGGTRCNLTHATDKWGIVEAFGRQGRFLHSALAALGPAEVVRLFEDEGVRTKVEETGKIFPQSDKALEVLQALLRRLRRSGAELALEEGVTDLQATGCGFQLVTTRRTLQAARVVLTTGGQSYPGCGTTGDGYRWVRALGHTIVPPRPALTPVTTHAGWVAQLRGVTIPDVLVKVVESETPPSTSGRRRAGRRPRPLAERRGSLLFTHFGLSGPAVLDVSRAISGHAHPRSLCLECDFLPGLSAEQLDEDLRRQAASDGKRHVVGLLPEQLPRRFAETLVQLSGIAQERRGAELSREDRQRLVAAIKQMPIAVSGTRGFKKAEVTAGGVALAEVDSSTMQSKRVPQLYLAGEILDLDGPIGGFNFQAAFSTGWLAGEQV